MIARGQLGNQLYLILAFIIVRLLTFHWLILNGKSLNLNYVLYSLIHKFPINYFELLYYIHQKYLYSMPAIDSKN